MLLCLAPKSGGRAKMQQSYQVKQGNYAGWEGHRHQKRKKGTGGAEVPGTARLQLQFRRKCERIFILVILFAGLLLCPGSRPLVLTRRGYFLTIPLYHASAAKEETDRTACSGELVLPARGKR